MIFSSSSQSMFLRFLGYGLIKSTVYNILPGILVCPKLTQVELNYAPKLKWRLREMRARTGEKHGENLGMNQMQLKEVLE